MPNSVKKIINSLTYFIVENEKIARNYIKSVCPEKNQDDLNIFIIKESQKEEEYHTLLDPCLNGINVGLISDAGCPNVADPGSNIISLAHTKQIKTTPLVGPSSILLAIMGSGLNGNNFAFNGYLPINKIEKKAKIKFLEKVSQKRNQSQIFIETPYRNNKMLEDLLKTLSDNTKLCIASSLTTSDESIITKSINQWRKGKYLIDKKPTIFIIHKY